MRVHVRSILFCASLFGLITLSVVTCTADSPQTTGAAEQAVVNPSLPESLNLILNAKTKVTIGAFTTLVGDIGSTGANGSVVFGVNSVQGQDFNVLADKVTVDINASVGHVFGNHVTVKGSAEEVSLGLDPRVLPPVPAVTLATPGRTDVSIQPDQVGQLCPGRYGAISLGTNSTLNLNGGIYEVKQLNLADGARLELLGPVVILVSGSVTTGHGAFIQPSAQAIVPMTAANVRIEVGGAVSLGDSNQVRAHLLVPTGKFTMATSTTLTGAVWAKTINIDPQSSVFGEGIFAAQTPSVLPCNDNNACTTDQCISTGATPLCEHTPVPSGTSCEDGIVCNGAETCDGAGQCQPGTNLGAGTSCADDTVCNGDETCDGLGTCVAGTPPEEDDHNPCTADACDPVTGVSHIPLPDGTTCSGIGVCQAGVCSFAGAGFSGDFVQFEDSSANCSAWNDFLFGQLTDGGYNSITMSGSFDTIGVTCSDSGAATLICNALHDSSFTNVFCNNHIWHVGRCSEFATGTELTVDGAICSCQGPPSRTVRPCNGFFGAGNWGGVGTQTCGAPSQTMTVFCE